MFRASIWLVRLCVRRFGVAEYNFQKSPMREEAVFKSIWLGSSTAACPPSCPCCIFDIIWDLRRKRRGSAPTGCSPHCAHLPHQRLTIHSSRMVPFRIALCIPLLLLGQLTGSSDGLPRGPTLLGILFESSAPCPDRRNCVPLSSYFFKRPQCCGLFCGFTRILTFDRFFCSMYL